MTRQTIRNIRRWAGGTLATILWSVLLLLPLYVAAKESDSRSTAEGRLRGNPAAPITLIEYSDFTCGYCQKFFRETWPRLQAKYVETGKVRFLYRDFPRASQGPGLNAASAARCAGDQGKYWPMHDRLYGGRLDLSEFQRHAVAIGLNLPAFTKCFEEGRYTDAIFKDKEEGTSLGFRGTPGFILMQTRRSSQASPLLIPGAFPFDVFEEEIDRLLKVEGQPSQP
ncbi:MAG: DsbA family protein [Nitrospirota bacterium]|nr:DsbA family protein [Nitrospirota bacterium]